MNQVEEMLVVTGIDFHQHVILAGCVMAFYHFGHSLELFNYLAEVFRIFQEKSDKGAGVVAQRCGFDQRTRAFKYVCRLQLGYALVYGGTAHATFAGYFQERLATVVNEHLENLRVELVNL